MADPVTIAESTAGPNRAASSAESVLVIAGCSQSGALNTPTVARNDAQPYELFGSGLSPLAHSSAIIVGEGRQPVVMLRVEAATTGSYGSIDVSGITGTVDITVDAAVEPNNNWEVYVIFTTGGTLGVAGVQYQTSLDGGRTLSALQALGTSTSIHIAEGNATLQLMPDGLRALVDECVDDYLAHIADATSHDPADTANTVSTAAVTTMAEVYAKASAIKTAAQAHANNTGGTYHDNADATFAAAVAALTTPTTTAQAVAFWNGFKAAFNTHRTAATVHPANDTTNVISATDAAAGTIVADDVAEVETTAPTFDGTTLATALATLNTYQGFRFGGICLVGAITSSQVWTAVINALDDLEARQRPCSFLGETRLPNDGESESTYRTEMETDWGSRRDNRVAIWAGDGQYYPTQVRQCRHQVRRSGLVPFAARHVSLRYEQSHGIVDPIARPRSATPSTYGGPLRGFRVYDDDAAAVGHDEAANPGLSDLRFLTSTTYPQEGSSTFSDKPKTRAPDGDTVYLLPIRRIVNVYKRIAYFRLTRMIQSLVLRVPGQTTMAEKDANAIDKTVRGELRGELSGRVSDVTFEIDVEGSDISIEDPRVAWNGSITTGGYIAGFDGVLEVNQ